MTPPRVLPQSEWFWGARAPKPLEIDRFAGPWVYPRDVDLEGPPELPRAPWGSRGPGRGRPPGGPESGFRPIWEPPHRKRYTSVFGVPPGPVAGGKNPSPPESRDLESQIADFGVPTGTGWYLQNRWFGPNPHIKSLHLLGIPYTPKMGVLGGPRTGPQGPRGGPGDPGGGAPGGPRSPDFGTPPASGGIPQKPRFWAKIRI